MAAAADLAQEIVEHVQGEFWETHSGEVDSQLVLTEQFGETEIDDDLIAGFAGIFEQRLASYGELGAIGAVLIDGILIGRELERRGIANPNRS